jgi:diguanylate cyclase (GGDEF)-like protein/PAS domain S-box-containing protein
MLDRTTTQEPTAGPVEQRDRYALFELALESAEAMTWSWDLTADRVSWAGRADDFIAGVPPGTTFLSGMEFAGKVYPDDQAMFVDETRAIVRHGGAYVHEYRARRQDGELRWFVSRGRAVIGEDGRVVRLLGVVQDITDRRRMEEALRASEDRFKTVLTSAPLAIVAFDTDGVLNLAQGSALESMGVDGAILLGSRAQDLLVDHPDALVALKRTLAGEDVDTRLELAELTLDTSYRPLRDAAGVVVGGVIVATDVSEKVLAEKKLARMALHDPLTDLANRVLFNDRLEMQLARSARRQGDTTVLFLDLDRFKRVNDTYGHEVGDDLLRGVAARLRASVRPEDTVARFGGDEFLVLSEVDDPTEAEAIVARIHSAVSAPMQIGPLTLQVGVSIGAAIAGPTTEAEVTDVATSLIRQADAAMYEAKQSGRGRYVVVCAPNA